MISGYTCDHFFTFAQTNQYIIKQPISQRRTILRKKISTVIRDTFGHEMFFPVTESIQSMTTIECCITAISSVFWITGTQIHLNYNLYDRSRYDGLDLFSRLYKTNIDTMCESLVNMSAHDYARAYNGADVTIASLIIQSHGLSIEDDVLLYSFTDIGTKSWTPLLFKVAQIQIGVIKDEGIIPSEDDIIDKNIAILNLIE